ncbi:MAG: hypothetical protein IJ867_00725 [Clostridia bacterium]|nr:hypothetical protein [Clostridia bacterium]
MAPVATFPAVVDGEYVGTFGFSTYSSATAVSTGVKPCKPVSYLTI